MTKHAFAKSFLSYATAGTMALSGAGCGSEMTATGAGPRHAFQQEAGPSHLEAVNAGNFGDAVFSSPRGLVIIDFYAYWCKPCVELQPLLEDLAIERRKDLKVYTLDAEKDKAFARLLNQEYGLNVAVFPFLAAFRNGELIGTLSKKRTREELVHWVDSVLETARRIPSRPLSLDSAPATANDETFLTGILGSKGMVLVNLCSDKIEACRDLQIERVAARTAGRLRVVNMDIGDSAGAVSMLQSLTSGGEVRLPFLYLLQDGIPQAGFEPEKEWWRTARLLEKIIEKLDAGEGARPGEPYKHAPKTALLAAPSLK